MSWSILRAVRSPSSSSSQSIFRDCQQTNSLFPSGKATTIAQAAADCPQLLVKSQYAIKVSPARGHIQRICFMSIPVLAVASVRSRIILLCLMIMKQLSAPQAAELLHLRDEIVALL